MDNRPIEWREWHFLKKTGITHMKTEKKTKNIGDRKTVTPNIQ